MFRYKNIYLRPIEEKDLEIIRGMRNDPSTWMNLTDITLIDKWSQKNWFDTIAKQKLNKRYFSVCTDKNHFVGLVRMDEFDWVNHSVRIGTDVLPRLRGKGYGTLIMEMLVQYSFRYYNMHRLWLLVLETNKRAQHIYRKVGFKVEGALREAIFRDGRYYDYVVMSLLKEETRK